MLNLNINQDNFSLRSYFNLENDFAKEMQNDPRFRFYNLYLEARNLFDIATVKLGRQPLFNSVAGGLFDGVNLDLKNEDFKLSGYYGGNVPAYQKFELTENWSDNYIAGGKFTTEAIEDFRIALSYINKNFKPQDYYALRLDENLNPINILIENNSNQYQFASAEVDYSLQNIFSIDTRFDYDLNFETASKFEAVGRFTNIENLGLNVYYNYRQPKIRYNSIFSVFDYGNTQEIELGADYKINENYSVLGEVGNVIYKDDNSQRITLGLITNYGTINYRKNLGYSGELDALSFYTGYTFLEGFLTPSLGIAFTSYKLSEADEKNNLTTLLGGVNIRPWSALSFDLQGQFMNNEIYKNDFRFFLKLNYWFNTNLNLL
ncbi:MAG: hypothetical protein IPH11_01590 [Ignavibacteriales bacterium]|nr:hypothetical protein [Ignavibacteriales bacterium]